MVPAVYVDVAHRCAISRNVTRRGVGAEPKILGI